jgi:UDP-N-acetylmuramoyl-tripeptide--D-alanyl-D-alanine ligase
VNVPLELAMTATGATLVEADSAPVRLRVTTDTRTLEPGDTFLALRGEHFDGHDFAAEAVRRGAAMLILDRLEARAGRIPVMLVGQTRRAYMCLAEAARGLFRGRVVAISGSTGKTTTRSFLAQLLASRYGDRVLSTPGNENNEIGVSKLLLNASNEAHDVAVVEMGARHYGDVATLVEIARPEVGILTNVGEAHLEIMGSRERLEETKWALFSRGAHGVLNREDPASRARASALAEPPHWFAAVAERASLEVGERFEPLIAIVGNRHLVRRVGGRTVEHKVDVRVPGLHNRMNLAAAAAGALELGVTLESLSAQIPTLQLPQGRYDRIAVEGGVRVIYDAYNANASGMIAALDAFGGERAARRIAVLGSMAELGEESQTLHERVGAHAATRVDVLLVRGEFAAALARGAQRGGLASTQIVQIADNAQAAQWLREHASRDDVVLLKGSRKYKLEEIVEELRA